jgi:hypothetical protein
LTAQRDLPLAEVLIRHLEDVDGRKILFLQELGLFVPVVVKSLAAPDNDEPRGKRAMPIAQT